MKKIILMLMMAQALGTVQAQAQPIITVAFLVDATGETKSLGQEVRNAAALKLVSSRLEFRRLGFDLRFKTLDDGGLVNTSKRLATAAVADPNVLALIGPISSGASLDVSDILAKSNLSNLLTDVNPKLTQRGLSNVFRFLPSVTDVSKGIASYIVEKIKAKKIFIVTNDNTSINKTALVDRFKLYKNITVQTFLDQGKGSVDNIVKAIIASDSDAIVYDSLVGRAIPIIKALKQAKVKSLNFASDELATAPALQALGADAVGLYLSVLAAPIGAYPEAAQFAKEYQKKYKTEMTAYGVLSHDALEVTLEALRQAIEKKGGKLPSRLEVSNAFHSVKVNNLFTGSTSFDAKGERIKNTVFLVQVGPDGNPRIVDIVKTGSSD